LAFATARLDRRTVVVCSLVAFAALDVLPVAVADYHLFVGARVVIGATQGLFIAAAITTATSIVPPERAGRAMAVVISGFATASALGLPLGTLLGQAVGWRWSFAAVVVVAAVVLALTLAVVPSVPTDAGNRVWTQARYAFAPRVVAMLALCLLIFTAIQSALTYLVPFLDRVSGIRGAAVSVFLLSYGVATTVGSSLGGRFADRDAARTLVLGTMGVTGSLVVMHLWGESPLVAALCVIGVGLFGMGMAPSMQHRVVSLAGPGGMLASSLPASAVNTGIAFGSFTGGLAIDAGGVRAAVATGAVAGAAAVVLAAWVSRLQPATVDVAPDLVSQDRA
jgi:DHA1 family inner membrane transport protein